MSINSMHMVRYVSYDNYISMSMDVWNVLVKRCDSVDRYNHIVNEIFSDGIINEGRLIILDLYTHCVCEKFPNNSEAILSCYSDKVQKLKHVHTTHSTREYIFTRCIGLFMWFMQMWEQIG